MVMTEQELKNFDRVIKISDEEMNALNDYLTKRNALPISPEKVQERALICAQCNNFNLQYGTCYNISVRAKVRNRLDSCPLNKWN